MAWPVFPTCSTFGFTKRADYSVTIIERSSGVRSVNRNWYYPLHVFSAVPMGQRMEDDIHLVQRFWHAVGGQSGRFLFTDYTDYKSSDRLADDPSALDQPLEAVTGSPSGYRLLKRYRDPDFLLEQFRIIYKPVPGTIRVANQLGQEQAASAFSIDLESGVLSALPGFNGTPTTWGGEFYVPVMFESAPEFVITSHQVQTTTFALRELRIT